MYFTNELLHYYRLEEVACSKGVRSVLSAIVEEQIAYFKDTTPMLPRNRILLTGERGNGKVFLTKAVATELERQVIKIRCDSNLVSSFQEELKRLYQTIISSYGPKVILLFEDLSEIAMNSGIREFIMSLPAETVVVATSIDSSESLKMLDSFQVALTIEPPEVATIVEMINLHNMHVRILGNPRFLITSDLNWYAKQISMVCNSFACIHDFLKTVVRKVALSKEQISMHDGISLTLCEYKAMSFKKVGC